MKLTTESPATRLRATLRKEAQAINKRNRVPGDLYYKEPARAKEMKQDSTQIQEPEKKQTEIETRICRDRDGWRIEARIPVAKDVYHWRIQGWTSGTKADARRSEREIRATLAAAKE